LVSNLNPNLLQPQTISQILIGAALATIKLVIDIFSYKKI